MSNERIKWLDVAKGIGIVFVVIGHAVTSSIRNDSEIAREIYNFVFFIHMPFLFFLSGIGYRIGEKKYQEQSVTHYIKKKGKVLLVPYAVYSGIVYLIFLLCSFIPFISGAMKNAGFGRMKISDWLIGLLLGDNDQARHLWYIYILFIFCLMTFLVRKVSRCWAAACIIPILFLVNCMFGYMTNIIAFQNMFFLYFWFILGVLLDMNKFKPTIGLGAGGVFLILYFLSFFNIINIKQPELNLIYIIIMKILSTFGLVSVALLLKGRLADGFAYLGKRIFSIYLFHQPFWGSCFGGFVYGVLKLPLELTVVLSILFSFTVPLCIDFLLKKTKILKSLFAIR